MPRLTCAPSAKAISTRPTYVPTTSNPRRKGDLIDAATPVRTGLSNADVVKADAAPGEEGDVAEVGE